MSQEVYRITGSEGGTCSCSHKLRKGKDYYLVDTKSQAHTLCEQCGKERGLDRWWGTKETVSVEEMRRKWFGGEPIKEVICKRVPQFMSKSRNLSTTRERMLAVAVEV